MPLSFNANQPDVIQLHPFSANEISTKAQQPEEDASVEERLNRLKRHYEEHGMRRFAEFVMLCHEHNHPHVMLLQIANSFHKLQVLPSDSEALLTDFPYSPGGWLKEDEEEIAGCQRILDELFEPDASKNDKKWEISDCVGQWWRPNFENSLYPYIPVHVTRPKELKKQFLIRLPQSSK